MSGSAPTAADEARAILLGDMTRLERRVQALESRHQRNAAKYDEVSEQLEAARRRIRELEDQREDLEREVEEAADVEAILKAKIERLEARSALALRLLPDGEAVEAVRAALEAE